MSRPLLKYREPVTAQDILTEAVPARAYAEGSALNLARAALFGVPLHRVGDIVELLRAYRGGRPNSLILGGPLGWSWQATLDAAHHGSLAGPTNAHRHSDLANIGIDDHHARDHATRHALGGADQVSLDASQIGSGRFGMARMPDGTSGYVLTAQGAGADPIYAAPASRFNIFGWASYPYDFSTTSTTFVDVTGMSTTITLPDTRTIVAFVACRAEIATYAMSLALVIDGTIVAYSGASADKREVTFFGKKDNVAAGSRTIKLQAKVSGGTGYVRCIGGIGGEINMYLLAMA